MERMPVEQVATIWLTADIPTRMFYAGHRWRVTDTPTRIRESIWSSPVEPGHGLYGWRFQATNEDGDAVMFDVYRGAEDWHVHHTYT
jgi:hypothetical protein